MLKHKFKMEAIFKYITEQYEAVQGSRLTLFEYCKTISQQDLINETSPLIYSKEVVQFDADKSDRDFFNAKRISEEEFSKIFELAK